MNTTQYLDAVKDRHNLPSDNRLAKFLNVARTNIANYRRGASRMDDEMCLRVAKALDIPPGRVLADIHAERATDSGVKKAWKTIARDYAAAVALIAIALPEKILHVPTLYIMLTSIINRISPGFCLYSRRTT